MALINELVEDLPPEPSRAIVLLADRVRTTIIAPTKKPGRAEDYDAIVVFILKFCKAYQVALDFPSAKTLNSFAYMEQVVGLINSKRSDILAQSIDVEIAELLLQYDSGTGGSFGVARLNPDEKKKIHGHIDRIRVIVESSGLSDRKRNALLARLSQLAKEVDLYGTKTDRFFALMGDAAFVAGDMAEKAKPFFDEVRAMMKILGRSRARQEGISLPPGDETLKLPSPDLGNAEK